MSEQSNLRKKLVTYAVVLLCICGICTAGIGFVYKLTKAEIDQRNVDAFMATLLTAFPAGVDQKNIKGYDCKKALEMTLEEMTKRLSSASPEEKISLDDMKEFVYIGYAGGKRVAYAALGRAQGYQSEVQVLVSISPDAADPNKVPEEAVIINSRVVSSQETPGLGENIKKVEVSGSLWSAMLGKTKPRSPEELVPAFQSKFSGKRVKQLRISKVPEADAIQAITGATVTSRAVLNATTAGAERIAVCFRAMAPPAKAPTEPPKAPRSTK